MKKIGDMDDKIFIKDLIAQKPSYPEAGTLLYDRVHDFIQRGQAVYIDMTGVESFPTTFMNVSFGRFIKEFGNMRTRRALKFMNIQRSQLDRIKRYFEMFKD